MNGAKCERRKENEKKNPARDCAITPDAHVRSSRGRELRAGSVELRAKGKGLRARSAELRAWSMELRAKSTELKIESNELIAWRKILGEQSIDLGISTSAYV